MGGVATASGTAQLALALFQFAVLAFDLVFVVGSHAGRSVVECWCGNPTIELMFLADLLAYVLSWCSFRMGVFAATAALLLTFVLAGAGILDRWVLALAFSFLKLGPILMLASLAVMKRTALITSGMQRRQRNKGDR